MLQGPLGGKKNCINIMCCSCSSAQFMDAFNVDFLVDPYLSEMVQDLFSSGSYTMVCSPYASGQGTSMASEVIPGSGRQKIPCGLYSIFYQVVHDKANATQCLYKTELPSQTEKLPLLFFLLKPVIILIFFWPQNPRGLYSSSRSAQQAQTWCFLSKSGKKWLTPSPGRLVSGKWHHILSLLFMSFRMASFSYT